jgi:hypothetical protein
VSLAGDEVVVVGADGPSVAADPRHSIPTARLPQADPYLNLGERRRPDRPQGYA